MQGQINSFADLILIQKSQLWFTTYSIHLKKKKTDKPMQICNADDALC